MTSLNRIILVGKAVDVPQLKYTTENIPFGRFNITVDRPAWSQGGKTETDIFPVVAWRRLAEIAAEFVSKNALILVEGRIQERSFNTEEGRKTWVVEIIATDLRLLGSPKKGAAKENAAVAEPAGPAAEAPPGLDNFSMPYFPMPEDEGPAEGGLAF